MVIRFWCLSEGTSLPWCASFEHLFARHSIQLGRVPKKKSEKAESKKSVNHTYLIDPLSARNRWISDDGDLSMTSPTLRQPLPYLTSTRSHFVAYIVCAYILPVASTIYIGCTEEFHSSGCESSGICYCNTDHCNYDKGSSNYQISRNSAISNHLPGHIATLAVGFASALSILHRLFWASNQRILTYLASFWCGHRALLSIQETLIYI